MFRALIRLVVIVVLLVAAAAFFLGYRFSGPDNGVDRPVGTTGTLPDVDKPEIDTTKAREKGAEIGERVAAGANQAQRALADGALTTKIKSKMALDDTIKALDINIDTVNGAVTLTGVVHSEAERARALQLARETDGVTGVTDRLVIR